MKLALLYLSLGVFLLIATATLIWPQLSLFLASDSCLGAGGSFDFTQVRCDFQQSHPYVVFDLWQVYGSFAAACTSIALIGRGLLGLRAVSNPRRQKLQLFTSCFFVLLALPSTVAASTKAGVYAEYLSECHSKHICNGTYLVARNGKPIFSGAFGHAGDQAETRLSIDHAFDIGSVSKQFTAMAVLQQVAAGKISLGEKVATYLPGFPYPDVNISHLLSHTSGVADAMPYYGKLLKDGSKLPITGTDVVSVLADNHMPAAAQPGARYEYSNTGYMVLAKLVEQVTGKPFDEYLEQSFFKPLGMKNTRLFTPGAKGMIRTRAFGFEAAPIEERRAIDQIPGFYIRGAGGIYSTAPDLLRWMNALKADRVVPRQLLELAMTPSRLSDGSSVPYGFGLSLKPGVSGLHRVSHGGHWRAFKADMAWYPDTDVAIIQLTNNNQDDSVDHNAAALATIANGGTPTPLPEPIGWALAEKIQDGSAMQAWFAEELSRDPQRYLIEESGLNKLGYAYLKRKEVVHAISVFKLATLAFPQSGNAFDSLADAYEEAKDFQRAFESMQSAVALTPASSEYAKRAEKFKAQLP